MKNTPIHVCVKTTFVGGHSADSRRIGSFHKFLSFNPYIRNYFKLLYRANVVVLTSTNDVMFLLFSSIYFWLWRILRRCSARAPTACEVVRDWLKFEKHCSERLVTQQTISHLSSDTKTPWTMNPSKMTAFFNEIARRHIPEGCHVHTRRLENLKFLTTNSH
jgi:hypothetical protein